MGETAGVQVKGSGRATLVLFPANYFEDTTLRLAFEGKKNFSIDEEGAKRQGTKANAPLDYVTKLQRDLIKLNYLDAGSDDGVFSPETKRAVLRFQRHARRVYRMPGPKDVKPQAVFAGAANGVCNHATAQEVQAWLTSGFVNPVGRFKVRALKVAGAEMKKLREDAADAWEAMVKLVGDAGGILTAEKNGYGDTLRTLQRKVAASKPGASSFSFHFCGRAVDIDQGFAGGKGQRYFIMREDVGGATLWRIFCKADRQDGTQGKEFKKGAFKRITDFVNLTEADIPAGFYVDMTALIESVGTFTRIRAQKGFDDQKLPDGTRYNKTEWWHFQYTVDIQEMELIGVTEKQLIAAGWQKAVERDHKPG